MGDHGPEGEGTKQAIHEHVNVLFGDYIQEDPASVATPFDMVRPFGTLKTPQFVEPVETNPEWTPAPTRCPAPGLSTGSRTFPASPLSVR